MVGVADEINENAALGKTFGQFLEAQFAQLFTARPFGKGLGQLAFEFLLALGQLPHLTIAFGALLGGTEEPKGQLVAYAQQLVPSGLELGVILGGTEAEADG